MIISIRYQINIFDLGEGWKDKHLTAMHLKAFIEKIWIEDIESIGLDISTLKIKIDIENASGFSPDINISIENAINNDIETELSIRNCLTDTNEIWERFCGEYFDSDLIE